VNLAIILDPAGQLGNDRFGIRQDGKPRVVALERLHETLGHGVARFGHRAESLPEEQMLLALEEVQQTEAGVAAEQEGRSAAVRSEAAIYLAALCDYSDRISPGDRGVVLLVTENQRRGKITILSLTSIFFPILSRPFRQDRIEA
jgi:hypothetical protein